MFKHFETTHDQKVTKQLITKGSNNKRKPKIGGGVLKFQGSGPKTLGADPTVSGADLKFLGLGPELSGAGPKFQGVLEIRGRTLKF